MDSPVDRLLKTVSEIRDLQTEIVETTSAIRRCFTVEESYRCFILRLVLNRNLNKFSEMDILSSPICIVQFGMMKRTASKRDKLETKLSELQNTLVSKFREHDYYQEQTLLQDLAMLKV